MMHVLDGPCGQSVSAQDTIGVPQVANPAVTILLYSAPGITVKTDVVPMPHDATSGAPALVLDDLLVSIVRGLELAQRGPTKSRAQALAITKLEEALHWLAVRAALTDGRP